MPYLNEHACRLLSPKQFRGSNAVCGRKRIAQHRTIIVCKKRPSDSMKTQAIRYPKDKWTVKNARKDCSQHHGRFTPARKK